jgi:hypothetical protein
MVAVIRARGELTSPTDIVNLTAQFYDGYGNPHNCDTYPTVSIIQPNGGVILSPTSSGVQQIDVGKYLFQYVAPFSGPYGAWNDLWQGTVNGFVSTEILTFIVSSTELPAIINSDGYQHLGDEVEFSYSQRAIRNINKLIAMVKMRVGNDAKAKTEDVWGNTTFVSCDIFSISTITTAIATSITSFNQIPFFTFFTFEDTQFIEQFAEILVEGATYNLLAAQALLEQGKQFTITDQGASYTPPAVGEMLNTQYGGLLTHYWEKLKYIKSSMRPNPKALGSLSILGSGANPQFKKLRHLRQRQIY